MTKQEEIEALAKELQILAQKKDYQALAERLPSPEFLAEYMAIMFAKPEVLCKFDVQIVQQNK